MQIPCQQKSYSVLLTVGTGYAIMPASLVEQGRKKWLGLTESVLFVAAPVMDMDITGVLVRKLLIM
jgi:hypothetical protein